MVETILLCCFTDVGLGADLLGISEVSGITDVAEYLINKQKEMKNIFPIISITKLGFPKIKRQSRYILLNTYNNKTMQM